MAQDLTRAIKVYLDSSQYAQSLKTMESALESYKAKLDSLRTSGDAQKTTVDNLSVALGAMKQQLQQLEAAGKGESQQAADLRQQIGAYEDSLRKANKTLTDYQRQTKRSESSLASMEQKVEAQRAKNEQLRQTLNNLSGATYNQLKAAHAALKRDLQQNLIPGTDQYNRTVELLRQTTVRMKAAESQWNAELSVRPGLFSRASRALNKYFLMLTASATSVTALISAGRKAIQAFAELEDAEAKVRKYTGLTTDEVVRLRHELASIDTRTSQMELTELAASAGRLGIKGVENLKKFVDASDKINLSLGEDLGKEAVTNIGKLASLFGEDKRLGLDKAMLSTASAVTVLAKNSTAAEPYLVEFSSRMGGVAASMNIAQSSILGMASALDQNMQKVEMSATAMQTLLVNMFRDPARFARIAGFEVKAFTDLLNTDANEAVVQFLEALHTKGGFDELAPLFADMQMQGKRAIQVISTLAGHTDQLREAQELASEAYAEGTEYLHEFNIMNETTQAKLEKARKRLQGLRVELGEKLKPILSNIYTVSGALVRVLNVTVDWLAKNGRQWAIITGTIAACSIALKAHVAWQKLVALWNDRIVVSAKKLYAALVANPWAAVAVVISVFVSKLKDMNLHLADSIKKTNVLAGLKSVAVQSIQDQANELKTYLNIAKDTNKSDDERLEALRRLRDINPEYLGCIDGQRIKTDEATAAVNRYIQVLQIQAEIEQSLERQRQLKEQKESVYDRQAALASNNVLTSWEKFSAAAQSVWQGLLDPSNFRLQYWSTFEHLTKGQFDEAKEALDDQYGQLEKHIEKLRNDLVELTSKPLVTTEATPSTQPVVGGDPMAALIEKYEGENGLITLLNERYEDDRRNYERELAQKVITKEQYNVRIAELDRTHYDQLEALYSRYHEEMSHIETDKEGQRTKRLRTIYREREKAADESAKARIRIEETLYDSLKALEEGGDAVSKRANPFESLDKDYAKRGQALEDYYHSALEAGKKLYADEQERQAAGLQAYQLYQQAKIALDKWYLDEGDKIKQSERRREFQEERRALTSEEKWHGMLAQDSIASEYDLKRQELDLYLKYEYMTEEEHQRALRDLRMSEIRAYYDQMSSYASGAIEALQQAEIDAVEAKYAVLIRAAENNGEDTAALEAEQANAKLEIQKKYALSNLVVKLSQITADTAVAIMTGYAQLGPVAGSAAAALLALTGAAQYASALAEYNKVKGMSLAASPSGGSSSSGSSTSMERVVQYASGRYDVIGASDGKTYERVPYVGTPSTGIVSQPALIAESGAELIVNAADLRRLKAHVNYGLVVDAINDARRGVVPQRAEGNYSTLPQSTSHTLRLDNKELLERLDDIKTILRAWPTLLKAYVLLSDLDRAEERRQRGAAPFTRKDNH